MFLGRRPEKLLQFQLRLPLADEGNYTIVLVELGTKPPVEENAEAKKEMEA